MTGKYYLNKIILEAIPQFLYLVAILCGAALSSPETWLTILAINSLISLSACFDFGRSQLILAGVTITTLPLSLYIILFSVLTSFAILVSDVLSYTVTAGAVLIGMLVIYTNHTMAVLSFSGFDNIFQFKNIKISFSRSIGIIAGSIFSAPNFFIVTFGTSLILMLRRSRINFDNSIRLILNRKSYQNAIIGTFGMFYLAIDKYLLYSYLSMGAIKPYSIVSFLIMGLMFLSALWYRHCDSENSSRILRIVIASYTASAIIVLCYSLYIYYEFNVEDVVLYAIVMIAWGVSNIISQKFYKADHRNDRYNLRIILTFLMACSLIIIIVSPISNKVLIYWIFMLFLNVIYLLIRQYGKK